MPAGEGDPRVAPHAGASAANVRQPGENGARRGLPWPGWVLAARPVTVAVDLPQSDQRGEALLSKRAERHLGLRRTPA